MSDFDLGKYNLGLTADEVTRAVIPYCGEERYNRKKGSNYEYNF